MDANRIDQRSGSEDLGRVGQYRLANADPPAERPAERRPEPPARPADRVEVSRVMSDDLARAIERHREQLEQTLEGRRELVAAVRKIMSSGGYDTVDAARRAADGMLRRGA